MSRPRPYRHPPTEIRLTGRRTCGSADFVYQNALFRSVRKIRNFLTLHMEGPSEAAMRLRSRVPRSGVEPGSMRETKVVGCGPRDTKEAPIAASSTWEGAHGLSTPIRSGFRRARRHQAPISFARGAARARYFAVTRDSPLSLRKVFCTPGVHPITLFGESVCAFSNRENSIAPG